MYSNPSWTSLTLELCVMQPRGKIQWQSLTTLYLSCMCLDDNTFEKIFSGCPVLSSLDLRYCWGFNRLEVNSPSLQRLAIIYDIDEGKLKISAPCIRTFIIDLESEYIKLCFENFKSLVRAEINLCQYRSDTKLWKKRIKQLFGSIRHVKRLKLRGDSMKVLSLIAQNGQLPQSTTRCLEIYVLCDNRSIPGIALLLESSPDLETLVIHGCKCYSGDFPSNQASKIDLDCDLFHLKTVCFKNFGDPNCDDNGELMLTLARILLKRAIVLEKMVVDFQVLATTSSTAFYEMSQELLGYPRFSQKAIILFR